MEILELEDLWETREVCKRELYRYDEDNNRRTDQELEDYLWELHCLSAFDEDDE